MKLRKSHIVAGCLYEPGVEVTFSSDGIKIAEQPVEQIPLSVIQDDASPIMHQELMPAYWDNDKLKPDVRKRLLDIANGFYGESGFKSEYTDIILTGSAANYNYTDLSDIDLHVLLDFAKENKDTELVKMAANGYRWKWNMQHSIVINGHSVECYIQDTAEEHTSSGVYSVLNDKWLVKPDYKNIVVDKNAINTKAASITMQYNELQQRFDRGEVSEDLMTAISDLRYKMLHLRRDAFDNGESEFSIGNLAFKKLRNDGVIGNAMHLETAVYDKLMSMQ